MPEPPSTDPSPGMRASAATAEFLMRMRARGIRSLDVLRVLEQVPRQAFVPHRYADLAARDVALPIGCGQTMPEPFVLARMLEALAPRPHDRVLEIGTGSGYVTAALARLAREVVSIERFGSLAIEARTRLEGQGVANAEVVWGDGLAVPERFGIFGRILAEGLVPDVPESWLRALAPDGALVLAQPLSADGSPGSRSPQHLVCVARDRQGAWVERSITASRLQRLIPGVARGL
jgi:protein-L-isoaspartate(D-aspartate) O-methyltransferase